VDLVRAVLRQLQFAKKMPLSTWNKDDILNEAIIRYYKFLNLMKLYPGKLFVPTLDVDLVWHAHQLNPSDYHKFTLTNVGNFIDHNDNIEKPSLGNGFIETAQLWKQNYNEGYSPVSVFNKWVTPAKIAASVFFPPYAIYLGAKAISMRVYNKKGKCGVFNEKKIATQRGYRIGFKANEARRMVTTTTTTRAKGSTYSQDIGNSEQVTSSCASSCSNHWDINNNDLTFVSLCGSNNNTTISSCGGNDNNNNTSSCGGNTSSCGGNNNTSSCGGITTSSCGNNNISSCGGNNNTSSCAGNNNNTSSCGGGGTTSSCGGGGGGGTTSSCGGGGGATSSCGGGGGGGGATSSCGGNSF